MRNNLKKATGFITRSGTSAYAYARQVIRFRNTVRHLVVDFLIVTLGVFSAAFGLRGFYSLIRCWMAELPAYH